MNKTINLVLCLCLLVATATAESVSVPHQFSAGGKAKASEVNANFQALSDAINKAQNQLDNLDPPQSEVIGVLTLTTQTNNRTFDVDVYGLQFGIVQPTVSGVLGSNREKFTVTGLEFELANHPLLNAVLADAAVGKMIIEMHYADHDGLLTLDGTTLQANLFEHHTGRRGPQLSLQFQQLTIGYDGDETTINMETATASGCNELAYDRFTDLDTNIDPKVAAPGQLYWARFAMELPPPELTSQRGYMQPEFLIEARIGAKSLPCVMSLLGQGRLAKPELSLQYGSDPNDAMASPEVELILTNAYFESADIRLHSGGDELIVKLFPVQLELILQGNSSDSFRWDQSTNTTF